jgi:hypothetical protein
VLGGIHAGPGNDERNPDTGFVKAVFAEAPAFTEAVSVVGSEDNECIVAFTGGLDVV